MICNKLLRLHPVNRKKNKSEEEEKTKEKRVHLWAILALNTKSVVFAEICGYLQSL